MVNTNAPLKTVSKRKAKQFSKPWITRGIRKSIKIKNSLFHSNFNAKYRLYRNKIITLIRLSKKQYFHNYFQSNISNMKKTWAGINEVINRGRKKIKKIPALKDAKSGLLIHDPKKLPSILNKHFASCGATLAAKLPHSERHFSEFLAYRPKTFYFLPVTPGEVESEISLLPLGKSHGVYSCPVSFLKVSKCFISQPLTDIMNTSILEGTFPKKLKLAKVVPVFKNGDDTDPNNYRPISLLSIFNRIFERLMYKRLKSFFEINGLFYESQYGFREKHSTQHALIDIVNRIQNNMDKGMFSTGVFIDLKKAFDTVDHEILLDKLYRYGIMGIVLEWFSSYLKGRLQVTQIGEHASPKELNPCGVPQGSVLGPLLFLIYINDIHQSSDKLNFFLFADDTTLLFAHKNLKVLEQVINSELTKVSEWLIANKLSLNIKKSNYVIFCPKQKKVNREISIKMYDTSANRYCSVERKDFVKFLGILIDCNLKWKHHIDFVSLKISKTIGILARLRHFVPIIIILYLPSDFFFRVAYAANISEHLPTQTMRL